jgi:hypothetical protein
VSGSNGAQFDPFCEVHSLCVKIIISPVLSDVIAESTINISLLKLV